MLNGRYYTSADKKCVAPNSINNWNEGQERIYEKWAANPATHQQTNSPTAPKNKHIN